MIVLDVRELLALPLDLDQENTPMSIPTARAPRPSRTYTRTQLARVLEYADRPDLAAGLYARRLDAWEARAMMTGTTCLAYDYDTISDAAAVTVILARHVREAGGDDVDFAAATRTGLPAHPASPGRHALYWPGWVLDEPTGDQWDDTVNECPACTALEDDPCPAHARAPWLGDAEPAGVA